MTSRLSRGTPCRMCGRRSQQLTGSRRALIFHEDKPGVFKFVWYCARQFRHHSFLCSYNGFFVDGVVSQTAHFLCFVRQYSLCLLPEPFAYIDTMSPDCGQALETHSAHSIDLCEWLCVCCLRCVFLRVNNASLVQTSLVQTLKSFLHFPAPHQPP